MPAKGGGHFPKHCSTRKAALAWARSTFSDELWRSLVEARDALERFGQGPGATAPTLAFNDARAIDRLLAVIEAGMAKRLRQATDVADGWEIEPFEPLKAALGELQAAMAAARLASRRALGEVAEVDLRMRILDVDELDAVRPPPTKGPTDEHTAARQNFIRLASIRKAGTNEKHAAKLESLKKLKAADWALLSVALGIEDPPSGLKAKDQWSSMRRRWSSALASVRSK